MGKSTLMTAHQLAALLNLSVETIWRYTRSRRIPYIILGERQYRYNPQDVMEALSGTVRESPADYGKEQPFTYRGYLNLPESMLRTEILDGILVQEPAPLIKHQRALTALHIQLHAYFSHNDPDGIVLVSPVDVMFSETMVLQPDLLYISGIRQDIITDTNVTGAPDLVVEIISPASVRKDRILKFNIYERFGVRHYWLVDAAEEFIETFALNKEGFYIRTGASSSDTLSMTGFPNLTLEMAALWREKK